MGFCPIEVETEVEEREDAPQGQRVFLRGCSREPALVQLDVTASEGLLELLAPSQENRDSVMKKCTGQSHENISSQPTKKDEGQKILASDESPRHLVSPPSLSFKEDVEQNDSPLLTESHLEQDGEGTVETPASSSPLLESNENQTPGSWGMETALCEAEWQIDTPMVNRGMKRCMEKSQSSPDSFITAGCSPPTISEQDLAATPLRDTTNIVRTNIRVTPSDPRFRRLHNQDEPVPVHQKSFSKRIESAMKREMVKKKFRSWPQKGSKLFQT